MERRKLSTRLRLEHELMVHYIIIVIIDVELCPLVVVIPFGLLYIPRRSSHLNHVLYLVL